MGAEDSRDEREPSATREESASESAGDVERGVEGQGPGAAPDSSSPVDGRLEAPDAQEVRLAPHGLRLLAFVDDVLFFAVVFALGLILGTFTGVPAWPLSAAAAIAFVYYMTATVWLVDGQTVGKAVCGLRVRRIDGSLPTRSRRDLAWSLGRHSIGYLIADVLLLGTVSSLFTPRRRCPHDYAFGSEVVRAAGSDERERASVRYEAFSKLWQARHEELAGQYGWILWPAKWLTRIVGVVAVWLSFPAKALGAGPSPPASAVPAARPLSLKGGAVLWTATTVATGVVITGIVIAVPQPDPIRNINVVTTVQNVGHRETAEIYTMKADGQGGHALTDNASFDGEPDLFGDRRIVFTSDRDGNEEVYVMRADGAGQVRLTRTPTPDWCPDWSPSGTRIAFTSNRDGNSEIYLMNADGSNPTRLTADPAADSCPDWSPDGRRIAFTSNRDGSDRNVYVVDADGTDAVRLTVDGGRDPKWSPSTTAVVFTSSRDGNKNIYIVGVDGRNEQRLTDDAADDHAPFWAPDGSRILFWSGRGLERGAEEVYVMDADGSDETRLTSFND
jgi:uncharacterized RDD family membrane protein YckC